MGEYLGTLGGRSAFTVDAYGRILRSLAGWVSERPGGSEGFRPELFTRTALKTYLGELEARNYSVSHRSRVEWEGGPDAQIPNGPVAVAVPESGIPRATVGAVQVFVEDNRRPSNAGHRF